MKILSLECSTARCSLAFMVSEDLAHEVVWDSAAGSATRAHHENMIETIERARAHTGWSWDEIEWFVAGRGPGNYSGLRASLLTVQSLAAPTRTPVSAVSSMDALALGLMQMHGLDDITIIGDARRHSYWVGRGESARMAVNPVAWETMTRDALPQTLPDTAVFATPHWAETAWLREHNPAWRWIPESQHPTALQVGRLALVRKQRGCTAELPVPIYAHPAV